MEADIVQQYGHVLAALGPVSLDFALQLERALARAIVGAVATVGAKP